jgi:hypothetical protein
MAKNFLDAVNLTNELQANGSAGTSGQLLASGGSGAATSWTSTPSLTTPAITNPRLGTLLVTASGGNTTLTNASANQIIVSGSTSHTVLLPDVTTLVVGASYRIVNLTSSLVSVRTSVPANISAITTGYSAIATVISVASNVPASWSFQFQGQTLPSPLLGITQNTASSTTFTLTPSSTLYQQFTGTNNTVLLPALTLVPSGVIYTIANSNATTSLAVQTSAGAALLTVPASQTVMFINLNGAFWQYNLYLPATTTGTGSAVLASNPTISSPSIANLSLAAGTTLGAPLDFAVGTNLTTPAGGSVEYDGNAFYATPASAATATTNGGRAVNVASHYWVLTGVNSLASSTAVQPIFGGTGSFSASATTTYEFEALVLLATGTTSHNIAFGFGGTATYTSVAWFGSFLNNPVNSAGIATATYVSTGTSATAVNLLNAGTTTAGGALTVKGIIRVNAAGTVIPQITFSAAPGGTNQVLTNSFMKLTPVGSNTVTTVGAFA